MKYLDRYLFSRLKKLSAVLLFSATVQAQIVPDAEGTVYVNHQANGSGSSWADAARNLSDALTAAQATTTIRTIKIAQGTYYPTGTQSSTLRTASFAINRGGLKLYGGYDAATGQRNTAGTPTILSGNIGNLADSTDNSAHVLKISELSEDADSVVVDGVTIRDGLAGNSSTTIWRTGGGIVIESCRNGSKVMIRNSIITMNAAIDFGGGVWIFESAPALTGCRVEHNRCAGTNESRGGGVGLVQASAEMTGCTFVSNVANTGGGAVYNNSSVLVIEGSRFSKNSGNHGGAILNHEEPSGLTLSDSEFDGNYAPISGGAIYNESAFAAITTCRFSNNKSGQNGGAITNLRLSENSRISDSYFRENSAGYDGGAVFNTETFINIEKCEFIRNTVDRSGGAIATNALLINSVISDCFFLLNESGGSGGALDIYESAGAVTVKNSRFEENKSWYGGALRVYESPSITFTGCSVKGNQSVENGGGAYWYKSPSSLIVNSLFSGNYSGNSGSALLVLESDARIVNCTFAANYTEGMTTIGAAFNSSVEVSNSVVLFNGAGGGIPALGIDGTSSFNVRYSACEGHLAGEGNLNWQNITRAAFRDIPDFDSAPTSAGDYRPVSIFWNVTDKGSNSLLPSAITGDVAGRPRIHGGTVDIGAYEYQGLPFYLFELYVDGGAAGAGTGASWADAAPGLTEALVLAEETPHAHTIHVAGGTYYPTDDTDRDRSFVLLPRSMKLLGGYDPATGVRNPAATPSVLSGNIGDPGSAEDNSYHVMVIAGAGNDSTIVDGFTISHGNANGASGFVYNGIDVFRAWGGGIFVTSLDNTAKIAIRNCIVSGNEAATYGGGVSNFNTALAVVNSAFHGNRAAYGGGISNMPLAGSPVSLSVIQSTIAGNNAATGGGGVYLYNYGSLSLASTLIYGNNTGLEGGPGMEYTARNCLIQGRSDVSNGNLDGTLSYTDMFEEAVSSTLAPTSLGNYRLSANSPAIERGSNAAASGIATDLDFKPRIFGQWVDIGAYEYRCTKYMLPDDGDQWVVAVSQGQLVTIGDLCGRVGSVLSIPGTGYQGNLTVQGWTAGTGDISHGPAHFVRRYHAVSAAAGGGGALVTFYYDNADFKAYNQAYGNAHNARLPDIEDETPVTTNLKIVKYSGAGSGDGLPGTYPGEWEIVPLAGISWIEEYGWWAVTFQTNSFSGFFVTGQSESALPVALLSFKAEKQENAAALTWQTTEEKNFSHFEVERSTDALTWGTIGVVPGRDRSGAVSREDTNRGAYSFRDNLTTADYQSAIVPYYYRLKMVDLDGTYGYSPIESVLFEGDSPLLSAYPNPSQKGMVKLEVKGVLPTGIVVYDLSGRRAEVHARSIRNSYYELDFSRVVSGTYTILVFHESGVVTRKQVVY